MNDSTRLHLPSDVRHGAKEVAVGRGLTGLLWTGGARLSPAARQHLRSTFPAVAVQAFTATTEQYWQQWLSDDNLDDLSGLVVVFDATGLPVAWVASNDRRFGGRTCFYAASAGVHPDHQGTGISSTIWRVLLRSAIVRAAPRSLYAVMRTGNPLVYGAWSSATGRDDATWPAPGFAVPEHVRRIAADAAADLDQADRLDPDTLVITDAYDDTEAGLWTQRPTSDRTDVDEWFARLLGPRDAVVLVVRFNPLQVVVDEALRQVRRALGLRTSRSSRSSRARS
ncbi:GNAT family N-acetyltransferase [Saccharopolyspora hordei]|uniref:GNAT superfamily N-acetyltransferase n=1 Tax=Saccharopolyspora hordei TaxID=1838 RepID=A0A853AL84_9PSEU|nr:GNAT family N-acetyltransferase [Saccharopolyspora hordei]NYI84808.1 GNAT superfamily N-acetyltransferase [Saccharopolyspora hordei]